MQLLAWTAAIEAAGALGSLITFGGAEAPAQIAEAGRIAVTAARIGSIISRLVEFAVSVGETFAGIAGRIGQVAQRLSPILGASGIKVTVEQAEDVTAAEVKDAEAAAEGRLASEATPTEPTLTLPQRLAEGISQVRRSPAGEGCSGGTRPAERHS